ncbi:MAG: hypothetical protein LBJ67_13970 [Planctomycetaceae bacterium]|jgi:hypothetical protein|nr:hypothetical protein [Planctomycetaceae bacterium]
MKIMKLTFVTVSHFRVFFTNLVPHSRGDKPEAEFPQLSATVNFDDVTKRMHYLDDLVKNEMNFHGWLNPPILKKVQDVPNFDSNINLFFHKYESKIIVLRSVEIGKRSLKRRPCVCIGFYNNGTIGLCREFLLGHYIVVDFYETGKLSQIDFQNFVGNRKIEFDENEKIAVDTYQKFDNESFQIRLKNRQQMDDETQASIKTGDAKTQSQSPKEWKLKLFAGLERQR